MEKKFKRNIQREIWSLIHQLFKIPNYQMYYFVLLLQKKIKKKILKLENWSLYF